MFIRHLRASAGAPAVLPSSFNRSEQRIVKDDVKTQPVRDPYLGMLEAAEKMIAAQPAKQEDVGMQPA